jgi:hypothetical protein
MKRQLSLRMPEPLNAVARHPVAAAGGGLITALVFGVIGADVSGSSVAVMMTLAGLAIGAPGAAYIAASVDRD